MSQSVTEGSGYETVSDDDEESEDDYNINEETGGDEYEDYDPVGEFEDRNSHIFQYRYIVLEGLINASEVQNHFSNKWGADLNKLFDVIDTKEKKFIEFKTTTNLPKILEDYSKHKNTGDNTSLIIVDLNETLIDTHNKDDEMPGTSKAYNFLMKRKALMKTLMLEDRKTDEFSLNDLIFKNNYINETFLTMEVLFKKH